jgi:hypothetical protein
MCHCVGVRDICIVFGHNAFVLVLGSRMPRRESAASSWRGNRLSVRASLAPTRNYPREEIMQEQITQSNGFVLAIGSRTAGAGKSKTRSPECVHMPNGPFCACNIEPAAFPC